MSEIVKIEISFPVPIEIDNAHLHALDDVLTTICRAYEAKHPGRIMWPFGSGAKMLVHPLMLSDDEPIPFDDSVYSIEMAEREAYEGERNHVGAPQMSERLIFADYELRGGLFEVWSDGHSNPGMYPNWWLATEDKITADKCKVPPRTVLTEDDFDPPLTIFEIESIGAAVLDSFMR